MLHALLPAYIHRQSDEHLLELIQACEKSLLDGTSTHGDMITLVECEKEMLQREHRRVRRTLAGLRPQDYINPKVSLSSLAAQHPVDLPAEAFDTDSGTTRKASPKSQSGSAPTGRRARTGPLQAKPAATSGSRPDVNKPEKFNLRRAVARRFGAKQAVAEKADVRQSDVKQSVEKKARVPQAKSVAARPVQVGARPKQAKRVPVNQASPKRQRPTTTSASAAPARGSRPNLKTRATPQRTRREAVQRMPERELQD